MLKFINGNGMLYANGRQRSATIVEIISQGGESVNTLTYQLAKRHSVPLGLRLTLVRYSRQEFINLHKFFSTSLSRIVIFQLAIRWYVLPYVNVEKSILRNSTHGKLKICWNFEIWSVELRAMLLICYQTTCK